MDFITRFLTTITEVHPIHTPTTHFPIALTGAALLFLLLALWRKNEFLEHAAFYTITLAAISTLLAGATGIRDNIVRFDGDAPLANVKIFLGITLLVITTVTAVTRWRKPEVLWTPQTMMLYGAAFAVSFMLAMTLGFIGGVILYGF
jgi:uncharacterized membrane protein